MRLAASVLLLGGMLAVTPQSRIAAAPSPSSTAEPAPAATPTMSAPRLTPQTFADPPVTVRPMYRYWLPLAYVEDSVLREQLKDIADAGGGGVEIAPFIVPGPGNQSNAFLREYGWGTPAWAHRMEVITDTAADLGLVVDQNLGPHYPPTVPTLNNFNQRAVEQQVIYGREFNAPGSTRTGALPAPITAPPAVSTTLCEPTAPGDTTLGVASLGGLAVGDQVTIGAGTTAEEVTVTSTGDRTAACGELGVTEIRNPHPLEESLKNVARTHRIRTVAAQCAEPCGATTTGPVQLVPSSVVDVTDKVQADKLEYTFDEGNGNPWVVIDFLQTASGLTTQSNGYTEYQPNYVVDHWNVAGVRVQSDFWDKHVLTPEVRANLRQIGRGALFEDSLELGKTQKWTWDFAEKFEQRRGHDIAAVLPALAGVGLQGTDQPAFELPGIGHQAREDYRQTLSDLYVDEYVKPMQKWARTHGLEFRVQAYGTPISTATASAAAGIPEGESLNFGGPNEMGAEQNYRAVAAGAHLSGNNIVSTECCANFFGGYRSSAAGPNVPGTHDTGGDGTQPGGRYSMGLLDSINKAYAGGVNQLVWHGYPYRDAPGGGTTGGQGGTWPGYNPWDLFNVLNVNEMFGPRQASWPHYHKINETIARTQLVLRQGRATLDLGVYYEDLGLNNRDSVGEQQEQQHMLSPESATSKAGYTYEYVSPTALANPRLEPDADGGLFGNRSDHEALILNDQATMSLANAQRILDLANGGLRIFIVGQAPDRSTGVDPADRDSAQLKKVVAALLRQRSVTQVADEAALPAALRKAGIHPTVTPHKPTSALGFVRREANNVSYDYIYNRSAATVRQKVTLTGKGSPYVLDTWTGRIKPVAQYRQRGNRTTVTVRVAPYDKVVVALATKASGFGPTPKVHATASTTELLARGGDRLVARTTSNGQATVTLSNGDRRLRNVTGVTAARQLRTWTLHAQTWTPGETAYTTTKTNHDPFTVKAGEDGRLPSWRDILSPVDLSPASGIGTYTTQLQLKRTWRAADGAYLDLGAVLDTAQVTVNGRPVVVNQSDRGRVDLGHHLQPGQNTIAVRVATTMYNAVRTTGDPNYQRFPGQSPGDPHFPWQSTGLIGPVTLQPYRDITIWKR